MAAVPNMIRLKALADNIAADILQNHGELSFRTPADVMKKLLWAIGATDQVERERRLKQWKHYTLTGRSRLPKIWILVKHDRAMDGHRARTIRFCDELLLLKKNERKQFRVEILGEYSQHQQALFASARGQALANQNIAGA